MNTKKSLIKSLRLEPHVEGGYFRRTYESSPKSAEGRALMSSIYYMLTDDSPIGYFHQNRSDILHYFHGGGPIEYYLLDDQGKLTLKTLGPDQESGQQYQLLVKAGYWKASKLAYGDYGLISEAVIPGFEYSDMSLATTEQFTLHFSDIAEKYGYLIKN